MTNWNNENLENFHLHIKNIPIWKYIKLFIYNSEQEVYKLFKNSIRIIYIIWFL